MEILIYSLATVTVLGLICGIILVIASKVLFVPVDERIGKIREVLPSANCGACGFPGCDGYAAYLVGEGDINITLCSPGGETVAKQIGDILGKSFDGMEAVKATVRCVGTNDVSKQKLEYSGPSTCEACHTFYSGSKECVTGCMGFGDCVNVCEFDALSIINGVAVVNRANCTGCTACTKVCPHNLIFMTKESAKVHVCCSSHEKGAVTRKQCTAGCIACTKCEKTCQYDAIHVKDGLAVIDYDKCTSCGDCIDVCPVNVIKRMAV